MPFLTVSLAAIESMATQGKRRNRGTWSVEEVLYSFIDIWLARAEAGALARLLPALLLEAIIALPLSSLPGPPLRRLTL